MRLEAQRLAHLHELIAGVPSASLLGPVTGSSRAPSQDLRILSPSILFELDVIPSVALLV